MFLLRTTTVIVLLSAAVSGRPQAPTAAVSGGPQAPTAAVSGRPQAPTAASEDAKYAYKGPIYKPADPNVYVYDPREPAKAWSYYPNKQETPSFGVISLNRAAAPVRSQYAAAPTAARAAQGTFRNIQLQQAAASAPFPAQFPVVSRGAAPFPAQFPVVSSGAVPFPAQFPVVSSGAAPFPAQLRQPANTVRITNTNTQHLPSVPNQPFTAFN